MKRATILLAAFLCVAVCAQGVRGLTERIFKTKPNSELKGSMVRVFGGTLYVDRNAAFIWEVYNANGRLIDRGELLLDRPLLRQWMNSDEPVAWLRTNVLNHVQLESND
jgi:hypothetical protein